MYTMIHLLSSISPYLKLPQHYELLSGSYIINLRILN